MSRYVEHHSGKVVKQRSTRQQRERDSVSHAERAHTARVKNQQQRRNMWGASDWVDDTDDSLEDVVDTQDTQHTDWQDDDAITAAFTVLAVDENADTGAVDDLLFDDDDWLPEQIAPADMDAYVAAAPAHLGFVITHAELRDACVRARIQHEALRNGDVNPFGYPSDEGYDALAHYSAAQLCGDALYDRLEPFEQKLLQLRYEREQAAQDTVFTHWWLRQDYRTGVCAYRVERRHVCAHSIARALSQVQRQRVMVAVALQDRADKQRAAWLAEMSERRGVLAQAQPRATEYWLKTMCAEYDDITDAEEAAMSFLVQQHRCFHCLQQLPAHTLMCETASAALL